MAKPPNKVKMKKVVVYADVTFRPGATYWITDAIFNAVLPDGSRFSEHCMRVP